MHNGRNWILLLTGVLVAVVIYFASFIPSSSPQSTIITTDAIVVLTGGKNRIETGIKLLEDNPSKKLFITGVSVKLRPIKHIPQNLKDNIDVGTLASTTQENAIETKLWIEQNNIRSITIVTANYHVPRSLLEFKKTMPNIYVESYPVLTKGFRLHKWWTHAKTIKLLCKECFKYLASKCDIALNDRLIFE